MSKKWYLHGEYDTLLNGSPTTTLITLICTSQEEAQNLMEDRIGRYKNMHISNKITHKNQLDVAKKIIEEDKSVLKKLSDT